MYEHYPAILGQIERHTPGGDVDHCGQQHYFPICAYFKRQPNNTGSKSRLNANYISRHT
jgi:hypothetical protein